ncbi:MAG: bleomycin resistance protein [Chlorobiaceae bacterium]|nr:bleomycin resistance protein [Chlorobiaceae bacterium]
MGKTIGWFEIPANDLARAKKFYGAIFDIQFQDTTLPNGVKMALFPTSDRTVGGALCEHRDYYKPGHQGVLVYFSADPDMQLLLDRIIMHGGKILVQKTFITPEYGYMAVFEDVEGNRLALHSMI